MSKIIGVLLVIGSVIGTVACIAQHHVAVGEVAAHHARTLIAALKACSSTFHLDGGFMTQRQIGDRAAHGPECG